MIRRPAARVAAGPLEDRMIRRTLLVLTLLFGVAGIAGAMAAVDPTGKWVGSVDTPNGPIELTYEFKLEGEAVTGTVSSAMGTLPISNGKVAADRFTYDVQIESATIAHEATINDAGDEIAIKATGDWGTSEYVVKKAPAVQP
jgi:hypothetical protein